MKTLYIIRHAKSNWGDFTLPDFQRPLNERGKKDAPDMAERLLQKDASVDIFVSSPAKRAIKTCKLFCKAFKYDTDDILVVDELYHASVPVFFKTISRLDDHYSSAAIVSHNPGITEFVNTLGLSVKVDNMPTCAVFAVSIDSDSWASFESDTKNFILFDYPKSIE